MAKMHFLSVCLPANCFHILGRQTLPAEAVRQVQKSMTFSGEKDAPGSIIKAAGLKILE